MINTKRSIGSENEPCKNIFDAIRILEPSNAILNAQTKSGSVSKRKMPQMVKLPNGKIVLIATTGSSYFYRGENDIFSSCKANLFRISGEMDRLVAEIRAIEFIDFLKTLPEVGEYEEQNYYVAYEALAQHYGFATSMLDITDDLVVAAFFATHKINPITQRMDYIREGTGRIRFITQTDLHEENQFTPIGYQFLARPAAQSAYGLFTEDKDDFATISDSICFYQDEEMNMRLAKGIPDAENIFLPPEHKYDFVVDTIKNYNMLYSGAVKEYCTKHKKSYDDVVSKLKKKYEIVDAPLIINEMLVGFSNFADPVVD